MSNKLARKGPKVGLTPAKRAALIAAFGESTSIRVAAGVTDTPYPTLTRWLRQGEDGHPDFIELYAARTAALAREQIQAEANVKAIAEGETPQALRANLKILSVRNPEEWGEQQTTHNIVVTNTKSADDSQQRLLAVMTDRELRILDARLQLQEALDNGATDDELQALHLQLTAGDDE